MWSRSRPGDDRDSANVIAEFPDADPDAGVVVLGGHYDTVADVDGANDNSSGISALLTIARYAAERSYPFALRFIAFGTEEEGLLGSREYVDSLSDEEAGDIIAMLDFDVLGSGDTVAMIAIPRFSQLVIELGKEIGVPMRIDPNLDMDGGSSDFAPFEAAGVPFVFFFADDFSRIHTTEDTLEHVDPARIGEAVALGLATLEALAAGHGKRADCKSYGSGSLAGHVDGDGLDLDLAVCHNKGFAAQGTTSPTVHPM